MEEAGRYNVLHEKEKKLLEFMKSYRWIPLNLFRGGKRFILLSIDLFTQ